MLALTARRALVQPTRFVTTRALSTLEGNPHIVLVLSPRSHRPTDLR
jgi:hypothetical protein